jgi:hypothetical protein
MQHNRRKLFFESLEDRRMLVTVFSLFHA